MLGTRDAEDQIKWRRMSKKADYKLLSPHDHPPCTLVATGNNAKLMMIIFLTKPHSDDVSTHFGMKRHHYHPIQIY